MDEIVMNDELQGSKQYDNDDAQSARSDSRDEASRLGRNSGPFGGISRVIARVVGRPSRGGVRNAAMGIVLRPSGRMVVFAFVLLLVVSGVIGGPVEPATLLVWGERAAAQPWFVIGTVGVMALMFTVGLPGSLCLWLLAPFHPPWLATILLTVGGVLGAAGAYWFSSWVGQGWKPGRIGRRVMRLLSRQGGLLTQVALRVLPGFPHQVVNFGAGLLRLPRRRFVAATTIGLTVKWAVYASAVYGVTEVVIAGEASSAAEAVTTGEALQPGVLIPLVVLTALLLTGALVRRRISER